MPGEEKPRQCICHVNPTCRHSNGIPVGLGRWLYGRWVGGATVKMPQGSLPGELLKFRLTVECWPPAGPRRPRASHPPPQMKLSGNLEASHFQPFRQKHLQTFHQKHFQPFHQKHLQPSLRRIRITWGPCALRRSPTMPTWDNSYGTCSIVRWE